MHPHVLDRESGPPGAAGPTTAPAPRAPEMPTPSLAALATAGPAARGRALGQIQRGAGNAAVARLLGGAPRSLQRFVKFPAAEEKTVGERIETMHRELLGMHADRKRICLAYLDLKSRNEDEHSNLLEGWVIELGLRSKPTEASPAAATAVMPSPPAETGRQTLSGEESAAELENKLDGLNVGITGLEHEIFVATFLDQRGALKGPEHLSVGASKIYGGGGEIDAMATIGEQKYLVEAKAAGVTVPPSQTKKNVALILEHRGEYGMAWAIDSPHAHAKEFIKYVSKIHQALRDVGVPGLSTHNEGKTLAHFRDTYKDGDPDEAWYIKRALQAASSSPGKNETAVEKEGKAEKEAKIDPERLAPLEIKGLDKMVPLMEMLAHVPALDIPELARKVNEQDLPGKARTQGRKIQVLRDLLAEREKIRPLGADEIPTDPSRLSPQQADTLVTFYRNELDQHGIKFFLLQLNSELEGPQSPAGGAAATPFAGQPTPTSPFMPAAASSSSAPGGKHH